ncbi:MAG: hypothetical protein HN521_20780, partial [Candidatus Latescibacteria bacterium]|nr:hypothetical protein [Candidatus Latescibacterota bacterium]
MPGLAGFTSLQNLSPQELDTRLQALKRNMIVPPHHTDHEILFGPQTAGTHFGPEWQSRPSVYQNQKGLIAWLDGTLYNRKILCEQNSWSFESDIEFIVSVVTNPDHQRALNKIDGLFAAVIL